MHVKLSFFLFCRFLVCLSSVLQNALFLASKCSKMRLAVEYNSDPLWELTALPQTAIAALRGGKRRKKRGDWRGSE